MTLEIFERWVLGLKHGAHGSVSYYYSFGERDTQRSGWNIGSSRMDSHMGQGYLSAVLER